MENNPNFTNASQWFLAVVVVLNNFCSYLTFVKGPILWGQLCWLKPPPQTHLLAICLIDYVHFSFHTLFLSPPLMQPSAPCQRRCEGRDKRRRCAAPPKNKTGVSHQVLCDCACARRHALARLGVCAFRFRHLRGIFQEVLSSGSVAAAESCVHFCSLRRWLWRQGPKKATRPSVGCWAGHLVPVMSLNRTWAASQAGDW